MNAIVVVAASNARLRAELSAALERSDRRVESVSEAGQLGAHLTAGNVQALVLVARSGLGAATIRDLGHRGLLPTYVLALTAPDDPAAVEAVLDAGVDDYLPVTAASHRVAAVVDRTLDVAHGGPAVPTAGTTEDPAA